jgi:hypothetical protein
MARGRPKKVTKRNIDGLRNQKRVRSPSPVPLQDQPDRSNSRKRLRGVENGAESDCEQDWDPYLAADGDSTKSVGYDGAMAVDDPDAEDVEECDDEWEGSLENETFCENLIRMGLEDSHDDEDWVPFRLQWLKNKRKEKKRV